MSMPTTHGTKGPLVAIGGAEDKTSRADILRRVLAVSGKTAPVVGVITTASSTPGEVFIGSTEVS